jgi:hypothetical protein
MSGGPLLNQRRTREALRTSNGASPVRLLHLIASGRRGLAVAAGPLTFFFSNLEAESMAYLDPTEYVAYGLTAETTDDWVAMASSLIDAHCRRPSLLITQYVERMRFTAGSQAAWLSYLPLAALAPATSSLVGVRVRYARPRRGELEDSMLAQVACAFSIPGGWSALDPNLVDLNADTGEVTFPANMLGLNYNEVEVAYTSGVSTAPAAVKLACAQIVRNAQATPALNVKSSKMDTLGMQYFAGSLIDANVQMLLAPYVAQRVG